MGELGVHGAGHAVADGKDGKDGNRNCGDCRSDGQVARRHARGGGGGGGGGGGDNSNGDNTAGGSRVGCSHARLRGGIPCGNGGGASTDTPRLPTPQQT